MYHTSHVSHVMFLHITKHVRHNLHTSQNYSTVYHSYINKNAMIYKNKPPRTCVSNVQTTKPEVAALDR